MNRAPAQGRADKPPPGRADKPPPGWAVVGALGVSLILGWGTGYFVPGVLGAAMEAELGLPAGASFLIIAIQLGLAGLLAPAVGRLIDRRGPRAVMVVGSLFYAAGLVMLAASPGPVVALLACLLLGIAAAMTLSEASNAALATLGAEGARKRIGALAAISGLAAAVAWPALAWAEQHWGWRFAVLGAAAAHLLVALPLHAFLVPRGSRQRAPRGPAPRLPSRLRWLSAALTVQVLVGSSLLANMVAVVEALGMDRGSAIFWASLTGPAQVAARLFDFVGGARLRAMTIASIALLAMPASILLPVLGHGLAPGLSAAITVPIFVLCYGLASGVMSVMRPATLIELHGTDGYATVAGKVMAPVTFAMALGPLLFAPLLLNAGADVALPIIAAVCFGGFLMLRRAARGL